MKKSARNKEEAAILAEYIFDVVLKAWESSSFGVSEVKQVKNLLAMGADLETLEKPMESKRRPFTLLQVLVSQLEFSKDFGVEAIRLLLESGVSPNALGSREKNPTPSQMFNAVDLLGEKLEKRPGDKFLLQCKRCFDEFKENQRG